MAKNIPFVVAGIFATAAAVADSSGSESMVLTASQKDNVTAGALTTSPVPEIAATHTGAQVTRS